MGELVEVDGCDLAIRQSGRRARRAAHPRNGPRDLG